MESKPITIKKLDITRMPGLPLGIGAFSDLARHINVVAGPNASGKSSTARLIGHMLWNKGAKGCKASMWIQIGDDQWIIKQDGSHREVDSPGIPKDLPVLPSESLAGMYILAMHKLVAAHDEDIAGDIARQMAGGYDIERSRRELGFEDTVRRPSIGEFTAYKQAYKRLNDIKTTQLSLQKDEDQLADLRRELDKALTDQKYAEMYEKLVLYLEAADEHQGVKNRLDAFPEHVEKLTGDEKERLQGLNKDIRKAEHAVSEAKHTLSENQQTLAQLSLPEGGIPREKLYELDELQKAAASYERRKEQQEEVAGEARAAMEQRMKNIDPESVSGQWEGIKLDDVGDLHKFMRAYHQMESEKQFLENEIGKLETELDDAAHDDAALLEAGITALSKWLQDEKSSYGIAPFWLYLMAAIGGISVVAAVFAGWYALAGLLAMGAVAVYASGTRAVKQKNIREGDYRETGLPLPEAWTVEEVTRSISALMQRLQRTKNMQLQRQRKQERERELEGMGGRMQEMDDTCRDLYQRLGALPELPGDNLRNHASLAYFLENVSRWQEHRDSHESAIHTINEITVRHGKTMDAVNAVLEKYGAAPVANSSGAHAAYRALSEQESIRKEAVEEIRRAGERIRENKEILEDRMDTRKKMYAYIGLEDESMYQLEQLLKQLPEYTSTRKACDKALHKLQFLKQQLRHHRLFDTIGEDIFEMEPGDVRQKTAAHEEGGKRANALREKVMAINNKIEHAMEGSDLEDALAQVEGCLDPLQKVYDDNMSSLTGNIVARHISSESRRRDQPPVMQRAGELFSKITQGRYTILIDTREKGEFRAFDNVLEESQGLDQLSTGTRIQLLMAVRIAYLEAQEQVVKPPLLADELFANSDDLRSGAIMEALAIISKEGRQVFYFTAQGDELTKWQQFLKEHPGLSTRHIFLKGKTAREAVGSVAPAEKLSVNLIHEHVPVPGNLSHNAYGLEINVPVFDLLTDSTGLLHVWYLTEDTDFIYHCLTKNIHYWGQLERFYESGGNLPVYDEHAFRVMHEKVKLLGRYQQLYLRGRSRPVERSVLADSRAVSDTFMDEVAQKLEDVSGNARALLDALRGKEVAGFRENKIRQLETYFIEKGYIDNEEPLDHSEIHIHLQSFLSQSVLKENDAQRFLELVAGAG